MAHNRLKNLSTAVIATKRATRILRRGVNQKFFFAQKLPDLAPRAEQTDATQACHRPA